MSKTCSKGNFASNLVETPSRGTFKTNCNWVLNCQSLVEGTANLLVLDKTLLLFSKFIICELEKWSKKAKMAVNDIRILRIMTRN